MKATLEHLKLAILGALLLAGLGIGAAFYGNTRHAQAARTFAIENAAFRQSQQRLDSVYTERREIDDYLPRFNNLKAQGALGNENRLDWIERIATIRRELSLPRLAFTIDPRAPNTAIQNPLAGLSFETSRMKLDFALVHEGDLLRVLERMRAPAMGVFEIRSCLLVLKPSPAISPAGSTDAGQAFAGNLEGACELDWISLTGVNRPDAPVPAAGRTS